MTPWVWFGVIQCTLQNFKFYNFHKTLLLSQSDSSKLYTRYHCHTGCHFFGDLPKIAKIMAPWNFLNTAPYAAGIFNFSHNFYWSLSKLCDIGYHGKSKCLLEFYNEKLASSTWDNIFYLKLFKTFLCRGSSVQAERQGPWASCFLLYHSLTAHQHQKGGHDKLPSTIRPKHANIQRS